MAVGMVQLGVATSLIALSLLLIALSFALDFWLTIIVDRSELRLSIAKGTNVGFNNVTLETDPQTFTRNRGMFRECFQNFEEAKFLDTDPDIVDGRCKPLNYEIPENDQHTSWGDAYWSMMHFMRAHFAFFVLSMLLLVITSFTGSIGCWRMSSGLCKATGLLAFLSAFAIAAGMAFFHAYEFYEKNEVTNVKIVPPYWAGLAASKPWLLYWDADADGTQTEITKRRYSYSYGLGWAAMVLAAVAGIVYLCAAYVLEPHKRRKVPLMPPHQDYQETTMKMPHRNRAYDYMEAQEPLGYAPYEGAPYAAYPGTYPGPYAVKPPDYGLYPTYPYGYM